MRWHITGDSFVEGVGAGVQGAGWAQQMAQTLSPDVVTIAGIGGSTSGDLLVRLPAELAERCDTLVVAVGINDSRYRPSLGGHETALDTFRSNLRQLIEMGRTLGPVSHIFVVGLTRVGHSLVSPLKPDKIYADDTISMYDAVLREVAGAQSDVTYVPVPPLSERATMLADGLHPSALGHQLLFEAIRPVLVRYRERGTE